MPARRSYSPKRNTPIASGPHAREVARQLRDMADRREVTIRVAESLPVVDVDVAAMELILVNLVSNAIKYSDPDKTERLVEVLGYADPDVFTVEVRDNGVGIDPGHLPHIFERAYRAHADRDRELGTDGFGLGLAIVQDCVADQGGTVVVESRVTEGTTFRVALPSVRGLR